jgi:hypothetical protein
MVEQPWHINEDRSQPQRLTLNGRDRAYCATGEVPSNDRENHIKERVESKARRLHGRLQRLIDDAALIDYSEENLVTEERKQRNWLVLTQNAHRTFQRSDIGILTDQEYGNDPAMFGCDIGQVLDYLCPKKNDDDKKEIIWGILISIYPEIASNSGDVMEKITSLSDEFIDRAKKREKIISDREEYREHRINKDEEFEEKVSKVAEARGINEDIKRTKIYSYVRPRFMHEVPEIEEIRKTFDQSPIESKLDKLTSLEQKLCADLPTVINTTKQGVDVRHVTERLWDTKDEGLVPGDIVQNKKEHLATAVLNRLSAQEGSELYTTEPVAKKVDKEWKLTDYGRILGYSLCVHDCDPEWIYAYTFEPEEMDDLKFEKAVETPLEPVQ